MNFIPEKQQQILFKTAAWKQQVHVAKWHPRTLPTCERLETVELKDIRFQHLDPWTANFRRQLWTDSKQPGGQHK